MTRPTAKKQRKKTKTSLPPRRPRKAPAPNWRNNPQPDQNPAPVDDFEAGSEEVSQEDDGAEETGEEEAQETEEVFEDK